MTTYRIKNWLEYQHYGDRRDPPWIKLHYKTLNGRTWVMLDDASRVLMIACMLVASQNKGEIPSDPEYMKRVAYLKKVDFKPLIEIGFLEVIASASEMLADASVSLSLSNSLSRKGGVGENQSDTPKKVSRETIPIPDWVPKNDWDDFIASRKSKVTWRASELIFKKLDEFRSRGDPPGEVLQQSIQNGWTGIFPLKRGQNDKRNPNKSNIHQPSEAATETRRRGIADALARRVETSGRPTGEIISGDPGANLDAGSSFTALHGSAGSDLPGEIIIPLRDTG